MTVTINGNSLDEYDWKREDKRLESVHRTRSGKQYRYKWGEFGRVTFAADQVNSATACAVNSLWLAGAVCILSKVGIQFDNRVPSDVVSDTTIPVGQIWLSESTTTNVVSATLSVSGTWIDVVDVSSVVVDVATGYIVNKASPFARVTDARFDLWQGRIELETF